MKKIQATAAALALLLSAAFAAPVAEARTANHHAGVKAQATTAKKKPVKAKHKKAAKKGHKKAA